MGTCFVIQPFDGDRFDKRYTDVFRPAIEATGLTAYRVDEDPDADVPIDQIERGIAEADVCLADITRDNPNVWFELGFAFASGKGVCLVCSEEREDAFPFDIQHRQIIRYRCGSPSDFRYLHEQITKKLKSLVNRRAEALSIASLDPAALTSGLSPHELAALASIAAEFDENDGITAFQLRRHMAQVGFTELATSIAVNSLKRREFITDVVLEEENGNSYSALKASEAGVGWLLTHQHELQLRREPEPRSQPPTVYTGDDIPF